MVGSLSSPVNLSASLLSTVSFSVVSLLSGATGISLIEGTSSVSVGSPDTSESSGTDVGISVGTDVGISVGSGVGYSVGTDVDIGISVLTASLGLLQAHKESARLVIIRVIYRWLFLICIPPSFG